MKQTLLDMTQSILSSLNSDEVNSISDTTESLQVAELIKQSYSNLITRAELPEHYELFQLDPSLDASEPVIMYKPSNVKYMEWLKYYNTSVPNTVVSDHGVNTDIVPTVDTGTALNPQYQYVTILPNQQFIDYVNTFNINDTDVETFNFSVDSKSYKFLYKNDVQPSFCTVIKDYYIIFDSFDEVQDDTLQASKTMAWGQTSPTWQMTDSFTPALDEQQFPLLLNEAKSLAFLELKQMSHPKAEQEVKRQRASAQKNKALIERPTYFDALPDYGRRGNTWRL